MTDESMFARMKGRPDLGLHTLLGLVVMVILPKVTAHYSDPESTRWVAIGFLVTTSVLALGEGAVLRRFWWPGASAYAIAFGIALIAVWTADARLLLAAPGAALFAVAGAFFRSVWHRPAIIESAAFWLQPRAPEFIRPYCVMTTGVWGASFAAVGATMVILAYTTDRATVEQGLCLAPFVFLILAIVEFVFRKIWFRHYKDQFLDRCFNRVFPAANTERGRRSQAYLAQMQAENAANAS